MSVRTHRLSSYVACNLSRRTGRIPCDIPFIFGRARTCARGTGLGPRLPMGGSATAYLLAARLFTQLPDFGLRQPGPRSTVADLLAYLLRLLFSHSCLLPLQQLHD